MRSDSRDLLGDAEVRRDSFPRSFPDPVQCVHNVTATGCDGEILLNRLPRCTAKPEGSGTNTAVFTPVELPLLMLGVRLIPEP